MEPFFFGQQRRKPTLEERDLAVAVRKRSVLPTAEHIDHDGQRDDYADDDLLDER
jgi:hypothetical protein